MSMILSFTSSLGKYSKSDSSLICGVNTKPFLKSFFKSSFLFSFSSITSLKSLKPSASIIVSTSEISIVFLTIDLLLVLIPRPGPITITSAHSFTALYSFSSVFVPIAISESSL